jgi:tetratricopeptide (TPR) repeat protein
MLYSNSEELSSIRQLKNEGKFEEALSILNDLENKTDLSLQDKSEIHLLKSSLLLEVRNLDEALRYIDLAYKESQKKRNKFQIIDILASKTWILINCDRGKDALEVLIETEQILNTIGKTSSIEFKEKKALIELQKGTYYGYTKDYNRSLEHLNNSFTIAKKIKNDRLIMLSAKHSCIGYHLMGETYRWLEYSKQYLKHSTELNDVQEIIGALNGMGMYYTEKGDFELALDYLEQGLSLCDKINSWKTVVVLSSLFDLYLRTNSLEKAQQCVDRMKQFRNQECVKPPDIFYRLSKASLLKRTPQKTNQLKAKEILKHIVEEKPFAEAYYCAIIELCDLFLKELRETNNVKGLDDIKYYITQLMDFAKNQHSFLLQIEIYSLRAKLKLITFEFEEAQNLLRKALNISEKYELNLLAKRIFKEQEELFDRESEWEALRKSKADMNEILDLAQVDEQLVRMLRKRAYF